MDRMERPAIEDPASVSKLPCRTHPYWKILEYCRHIGIEKRPDRPVFWCARIRKRNGRYKQTRLAPYDVETNFDCAAALARKWFARPEIEAMSSASFPVGYNQKLKYKKSVPKFTVGDAMVDFVRWKRIAATPTAFDATLSRINYHIIPRLGNLPAVQMTHRRYVEFCRDVLESPPKRGRQPLGPRTKLIELDSEALRKRKKTVNELISILRVAMKFAWENGELESTRPWRILKHLPHQDVPRQIFLDRDECRRLISQCRDDLRNLVLGALYTGCRVSELAQLRVADVPQDLPGIYVKPSKNGNRRFVFLPTEGMGFVRNLCQGRAPTAYVFTFQNRRRWSKSYQKLFKDAVKKAELSPLLVFHGLRHTYASQLVQAGTPLVIVAKQLGHATVDTVCKTYGHLTGATISNEISTRFSPLVLGHSYSESDCGDEPIQELCSMEPNLDSRSSWPSKNYSRFCDPLLQELKDR